jgi:hypothetical protein
LPTIESRPNAAIDVLCQGEMACRDLLLQQKQHGEQINNWGRVMGDMAQQEGGQPQHTAKTNVEWGGGW